MSTRERNALLVALTPSGPYQMTFVRAAPTPAISDEQWARWTLARMLAQLPCYSASELKRRCLSPDSSDLRPRRPESQGRDGSAPRLA